ncbi:regucalcin-like isoform X2 [Nycticebus coucang]|uniref:regucalcin-like isoform X2 n=1 Tax=Nycticebus coucang TaxID=9470 RepID=UPI00234C402B|nr:regucalcin-like isoform X2 [Nycticebus coucang]
MFSLGCDSVGLAMASPKIEAVIRQRHRMAECPVWEEETGQLVYVDINSRNVCRWNPFTGEVQTVGLRNRVGSVALCQKGTYLVAAGTCLGLLDWGTKQVQWVAWLDRDKPHNRFNDGKVDPAGRFVAGTMPEASAPGMWARGQGSLYTLYGDGSVVRHLEGLGIPNGLDWSLDHRTFYHVDSLDYCVRAFDYDIQTGGIANPRILYHLQQGQGMPDGMCVDTAGKLWVACIDGGRVIRVDPETGMLLCTVHMPVSRVTSCSFGGPSYMDLYVTSAADGLSQEQLLKEPQAGHVFKVTSLGVRGVAPHAFSG